MNVVDSSGWIEYLSAGPNAAFFGEPIEGDAPLVVPSLSLFEVYRHVLRHVGREEERGLRLRLGPHPSRSVRAKSSPT